MFSQPGILAKSTPCFQAENHCLKVLLVLNYWV
ncbi:hypothetical protein FHS90_002524 [Rufibacter quisquiliarum]|uniref:Uncharacterized protein n=1 Tax=Rufibacter quisquiliarum TaxID=1549639 RepID=A0A839GQM1_9BACT|nr:hypothetical protein [Rufibacter quisquiliarum]